MALGKNLKKQQLIPEKKKTGKAKVTEKEVKKAGTTEQASRASVKKSKPTGQKKTNKTVNKKTTGVQKEPKSGLKRRASKQHKTEIAAPPKLMVQSAKERERIRSKFQGQLNAMKGRQINVVVFTLSRASFALEIDSIVEVVVTPQIIPMPYTPPYVEGISNIRGETMVMINLEKKFSLEETRNEHSPMLAYSVIIEGEHYDAGILVNEVPSARTVNGDNIESAAQLIAQHTLDEAYIKGLIEIDGRSVFLLDAEELIESENIRTAAEMVPDK